MAATTPRLGIDHLTVVPADPDRDDAADAADAGNGDDTEPAERGDGAV